MIGKTAQLELYDFEADLARRRRSTLNGNPIATPTLYDLLTQVQKQAAKGTPPAYYLFRNEGDRHDDEDGDGQGQERQATTVLKPAKKTVTSSTRSCKGRPTREASCSRPYGGTVPPTGDRC